ncbi:MAG: glucose 1-dehydrogenase [Alphaproteobacteria bacterium]|jgi:NAD(P)-dependent dehydrogenase (short-subunit alcohol dehydrogenase family)|nr:glucose 1-dehydrogenase [Alphaproteobacteria bacterium]MDP6567717.1 glucose 1-dehydrogenase [Alphaproteobacteria bacterium]MDP6812719.1 glucose 1-dehydrogenase [Alphaproteobacteria bacterium]
MARLDGKVAIITGGTSGIGEKTVEIFVAEGAKVVFCGRREALGQAIVERLGENAEFIAVDVAHEDQVAGLIGTTRERHGRIDCLFNNAGCPAPKGSITEVDRAEFDYSLSVLVGGVMLGMKYAAKVMMEQGFGSIINNGSIAAHQAGFSSSMVYSAAKAAVVHLTRCVAMELGESGVRVNSISPGAIATGIFGKVAGLPDEKAEQTAEILKQAFATAQPIRRAGLPEDIAHAAVFLASDESGFINGRDIVVDGGMIGGRHWSVQQEALRQMFGAFGDIG